MTKPYKVLFDKAAGIVMVRIVGSATHEDHCAARDKAIRLCTDNGCSMLLVDLSKLTTDRTSTMNCFIFGESMAKITQHLRIAHVLPEDANSVRDVQFTSNIEANRGQITGEFSSVEEARKWLLQK